MSNATEGQQPQPDPVVTDETQGTQAPAAPPSTDADDWDLQELHTAMALAKAETDAKAAEADSDGGDVPGTQPEEGQAPQPAQPAQPAAEQGSPMIPKARLDEVLRERTTANEQAEYWRGVAEGRIPHPGAPQGTTPQAPAPTAPPQPTADQQLQALRDQQDELARRYDSGDLSFADLHRQTRALDNQIDSLREQAILQRVEQQSRGQQDSLFLEARTVELEAQHPYLGIVSRDDLAFLTHTAYRQLVAEGVQLKENDARSKLAIRERAGILSDKYGKDWGYKLEGVAPAGTPSQPVQTSATPQDRASKLALQGQMPPNTAGMSGVGRDDPSGMTSGQIESMSDEEIAALPQATKNRLLGVT